MLKIRVLTAAVFLAVFLPALYFLPKGLWITFCALGLGFAAWEWAGLAGLGRGGRRAYAASLVALFAFPALPGITWSGGPHAPVWAYATAALFWTLLAPLWILRGARIGGSPLLLVVGAATLLPAFAAAVDLRDPHPGLLLALLVTIWISDVAAYFAGKRFGSRKLAPKISPGKTWEGVWGALAAVAIYGLAWALVAGREMLPGWLLGLSRAHLWILPILLVLAVVGMIGDLFESLIKRQAGVKDSGNLLPGHGGMLDRIDAVVAMLPLAALAFMR